MLLSHATNIFAQSVFPSDFSHLWKAINPLILIKTFILNVLCKFCCPQHIPLWDSLRVLETVWFEDLMKNSVITALYFVYQIIIWRGRRPTVRKGTKRNKSWQRVFSVWNMSIHCDIIDFYYFLIDCNLDPCRCLVSLVSFILNELFNSFPNETESHLLRFLFLSPDIFPLFISNRWCPHHSNDFAFNPFLSESLSILLLYVFEQTEAIIFFLSLWLWRGFLHHQRSLLNLWCFLILCRCLYFFCLRDFNDIDFRSLFRAQLYWLCISTSQFNKGD